MKKIYRFDFKNFGSELADKIAVFIGSWKFIIMQSAILIIWVIWNFIKKTGFDPYPFILLNLFMSFEAAYATPLLLMSSNRQNQKDREQFQRDLDLDMDSHETIKKIEIILNKINQDIKIDRQALADHMVILEDLKGLKEDIEFLKKNLNK